MGTSSPPPPKQSTESVVIIVATILQGIVAAAAIVDYFTERLSTWLGQVKVFQWIIIGSFTTAIILGYLLYTKGNRLTTTQNIFGKVIAALAICLALFFWGLLIGESKNIVTYSPVGENDLPFYLHRNFDFEAGFDGWSLSDAAADGTITIEHQEGEAYKGTGFVRVKTSFPGSDTLKHDTILLTDGVALTYNTYKWIGLTEVVVGYIKILPTEQTIDNKFYAEIQVSADSETDEYWVLTRYSVDPGKWQPIVWLKPTSALRYSSDREDLDSIFYSGDQNFVSVFVWSEKPYVGSIYFDDLNFYLIK